LYYRLKVKPLAIILLATTILAPATLQAASVRAATTPPKQDSQDLRLELDKVTLLSETNRLDEARALLEKLKAAHPDNSQILVAEANLNLRTGNRGRSFSLLNKAMSLDPGNEDILDRQRSVLLDQGPFVSGGYNYRRTSAAHEHFARFIGQTTLAPSISGTLAVENNHINTRIDIRHANGSLQDFDGSRQRGTLTINKLFERGDEASAMLHGGNEVVGAGAQYTHWDRYGATMLQGNLNKPEWDYIEAVIDHGTRDNIRLERKQIFTSNLQATVGGGYNRYELEDVSDAADAGTWDLNLAYTHPLQDGATLGAYYTVDAEYFTHIDRRTVSGTTFSPLPASSYEVHSVNVSAGKDFTPRFYAEAHAGYGWDRLSDAKGPQFGATVEYALLDNLGAELHASRGLMGERQDDKEEQFGANLKWRW
jgi:hypothetical protein